MRDFPVTLEHIIARWGLGDYPRVVHGVDDMEHIFGEMYRVPEKIRIPYFKVKILEMLLYLDTISIPDRDSARPYFYRSQAEKVQAIHDHLLENLSENFTQEELSCRFDLPLTAMKTCFRSAYGVSMGAWLTHRRMDRAAELLLGDPQASIAEIGGMVGYDSASKFTVEELEKFLEMPPLPEPAQCADVPHTDVVLKNVRFSYTGEEKDEVLHGIDLTLPEGSFTALVGPSGGGKTTICSLLARFYDPQGGSRPRAGGCDALPCAGRDGTALLSRLFSVRHRRAAGQQISKCP